MYNHHATADWILAGLRKAGVAGSNPAGISKAQYALLGFSYSEITISN